MRYLLLFAMAACSKPVSGPTTAIVIVDDAVVAVEEAGAVTAADAPSPVTP